MTTNDDLDCILIGHNEMDFSSVQEELKKMGKHSAAYMDLKANSVRIRDERITYMDLLNRTLKDATGRDHHLSVCEVPHLGAAYLKSFLCKRNFDVEIVNSTSKLRRRVHNLDVEIAFAQKALQVGCSQVWHLADGK